MNPLLKMWLIFTAVNVVWQAGKYPLDLQVSWYEAFSRSYWQGVALAAVAYMKVQP